VVVLIHLNHPAFLLRKSVTCLVYIVALADWSEIFFMNAWGIEQGTIVRKNRKKNDHFFQNSVGFEPGTFVMFVRALTTSQFDLWNFDFRMHI
jgi:hypothetical protein